MELRDFCSSEYNRIFSEGLVTLPIRDSEDLRKAAQKKAIKEACVNAMRIFSDAEPAQIWAGVHSAHVNNVSGIGDLDTITKIISAENSWKKSSGHAFEEMIVDLSKDALKEHGIEMILQRDLSIRLRADEVCNEVRDISWLKEQVATSAFDHYLAFYKDAGYFVFGCVQSKTSIRDRVTRDREPSINAMKAFFVSVALVLDGDFLRLPKFRNMVNGNVPEYEINGWHGMYVFTNSELEIDRIHGIDISMGKFVADMVAGAQIWENQRQWLNNSWRP